MSSNKLKILEGDRYGRLSIISDLFGLRLHLVKKDYPELFSDLLLSRLGTEEVGAVRGAASVALANGATHIQCNIELADFTHRWADHEVVEVEVNGELFQ